MRKVVLSAGDAAVKSFAPATRAGPLLFLSGQLGLNPDTGRPFQSYAELGGEKPYPALGRMAPDSWEAPFVCQATAIYRQMEKLLSSQGALLSDIAFYSIYLSEMRHFPTIVRTRSALFEGGVAPPSTASQVPGLLYSDATVYFDPIGAVPERGYEKKVLTSRHLDQGPLSNYQLGTRVGPYLFFAGVVAAHPETGFVVREAADLVEIDWQRPEGGLAARIFEGPIAAQTVLIFDLLEKMLEEQGASLNDLMKLNIYLRHMSDLPAMDRVTGMVFPSGSLPPASVIGVQSLAMSDFFVEIEGFALVPGSGLERVSLEEIGDVRPWRYHSLATRADELVFLSGMLALDSRREVFIQGPSDLVEQGARIVKALLKQNPHLERNPTAAIAAAQTWYVLDQMERVLTRLDSSLRSTLKLNVYLADMKDFMVVEQVAQSFWKQDPPALTVLQVSELPFRKARVEIDAVALADR